MTDDSKLKELIQAIADAEVLVSEVANGFSFAEVGQLIALAKDIPNIVADAPTMIPEWVALDDAARADLIQFVQQNCVCPSFLSVQVWTQKLLSAALMLSSLI